MDAMVQGMPFKIFASVCALLIVKIALLASAVAVARTKKKVWKSPEDVKMFGGKVTTDEGVERLSRAHQNALENVLPFAVVGLLYTFMGASGGAMQVYCYTFFIARILHTLCYLAKLQPFRSISAVVGALCILGMGVQVLLRAFA